MSHIAGMIASLKVFKLGQFQQEAFNSLLPGLLQYVLYRGDDCSLAPALSRHRSQRYIWLSGGGGGHIRDCPPEDQTTGRMY